MKPTARLASNWSQMAQNRCHWGQSPICAVDMWDSPQPEGVRRFHDGWHSSKPSSGPARSSGTSSRWARPRHATLDVGDFDRDGGIGIAVGNFEVSGPDTSQSAVDIVGEPQNLQRFQDEVTKSRGCLSELGPALRHARRGTTRQIARSSSRMDRTVFGADIVTRRWSTSS